MSNLAHPRGEWHHYTIIKHHQRLSHAPLPLHRYSGARHAWLLWAPGHGGTPWLGTLRFPSGALHSTALWLPLRSCACKRPANAPDSRALNP